MHFERLLKHILKVFSNGIEKRTLNLSILEQIVQPLWFWVCKIGRVGCVRQYLPRGSFQRAWRLCTGHRRSPPLLAQPVCVKKGSHHVATETRVYSRLPYMDISLCSCVLQWSGQSAVPGLSPVPTLPRVTILAWLPGTNQQIIATTHTCITAFLLGYVLS